MKLFPVRRGRTRSIDQVGLAQFNIYEARTHFSRLVERAASIVTARIVLDRLELPPGRL